MKKFSITALAVATISVMLAYPFTKTYTPTTQVPAKTEKSVASTQLPKVDSNSSNSLVTEPASVTSKVPNFAKYKSVKRKKAKFFNYLRPVVVKQNSKILANRKQLIKLEEKLGLEEVLTEEEIQWLNRLAREYRVKGVDSPMLQIQRLLSRVDIVPVELVLVQGANESAWGTSRFAREGLNLFGMWCYKEGCGMVPSSRTEGMTHEVAVYDTLEQSVKAYLRNLNTNNAYRVFRSIRQQLRASNQPLKAEILATGLLPYSERGSDYVLELTDMLRHNQAFFDGEQTAP
ncbi:glucosaminidase domain-containing protein [Thalassotalea sp. LPB0316]|uniref:glucosaminidase domain-containing protein n=1 Tax=Thalassotalea sp. LPB0316 TaxID=2769490 RepID=UPI001866CD5B|nr:glucosaminidase domain-containing protein [Thalassotalea sp. LPB0316]QOL25054.1 glucosaminidase domain-containing protein [Thalassotalea sp. LPB0316]